MNRCMENTWNREYQRGRSFFTNGDLQQAIRCFRASIQADNKIAAVHHDLGVALCQNDQHEAAQICFEQAVSLEPRLAAAWFNGGNALCRLKRTSDAIRWFLKAVQVDPRFADAHYNLATAYKTIQNDEQALRHYSAAISADPNMPEAHNNLGTLLLKARRFDEAVSSFQRAIALRPDYRQAIYNLSLALNRSERVEQAIPYALRAVQLKPDYGEGLVLLVSMLQQTCDWPSLERYNQRLEALTVDQLNAGMRPAEPPFMSFTRSADPVRNYQVARSWSRWLTAQRGGPVRRFDFGGRRHKGGRIVVGYLSEQFRDAATAHLMADLFKHHDRNRFRIAAYSCGMDDGSYHRRAIEQGVDQFIDIRAFSDAAAAERIYHDGVDILVDLIGWMHGHRMGILALRPSPIQVNYLGFPGTTGADFMDYIIADPVVIPPDHRRHYSEKVVYLPHCYQTTDPHPPTCDRVASRREFGLPEGKIVFCSFSTDYKIEPEMFGAWMRILTNVPQSVLWLLVRTSTAQTNLRREAQMHGVDPQRLVFAKPLNKAQHLNRLALADLALDTHIVNGHTTVSDALMAGLPVITLMGTHFASRVAGSILRAIDMEALVTHSLDDYVRLATRLGGTHGRLLELKQKLSRNKFQAPLFDTRRQARFIENAYEQMWLRFRQGLAPQELIVKP